MNADADRTRGIALDAFERRVLDACLAGSDPRLRVLRQQAAIATVRCRTHTGVGAYVDLSIPDSAPRLPSRKIVIDDLDLKIAGVPMGVATLLYVDEGCLGFIEFATYTGEWPQHPEILDVGYFDKTLTGSGGSALYPTRARHPSTLDRMLEGSTPRHCPAAHSGRRP